MPEVLDRQPLLLGELIVVRPLRLGDFDALFAIASNPHVWEQHPSKDRTQRPVFQRWFEDAMSSGGALVVIDRGDGQVIGTSRFEALHPTRREVEIGWTFLAPTHWGGAYNAELKRLMLRHAFGAVDAVLFRVHSLNHRSQGAMQKLGAIRLRTEPDPLGRGDNVVYRLDRLPRQ